MKLTHIRLLVTDFARCYRFYHGILNFKSLMGTENDVYAEFRSGHLIIGLFKKENMTKVLGTESLSNSARPQDSFIFCYDVHDVDAVYKKLCEKGVKFEAKPHDQKEEMIRVAHLRDPEGNCIEINAPLKNEKLP